MLYTIKIIETLSTTVPIEATTSEEAIIIARQLYDDNKIELDYNDLENKEFIHIQSRQEQIQNLNSIVDKSKVEIIKTWE